MSPAPATVEPAAEATSLLIQAASVFWGHFVARSATLGLAPTQAHALMAVAPDRPSSMRDLADSLECDPSTITGVADRLEVQGLLERGSQAGDRRVRTLTLTPAGLARREQLIERLGEPTESLRGLGADDLRALVLILEQVLAAEATGRGHRRALPAASAWLRGATRSTAPRPPS